MKNKDCIGQLEKLKITELFWTKKIKADKLPW
jgi:hypothetical protein